MEVDTLLDQAQVLNIMIRTMVALRMAWATSASVPATTTPTLFQG
jgi:hypothetical protein